MIDDPRITRLAGEAEDVANDWTLFKGVEVATERARRQVSLTTWIQGPVPAMPDGMTTTAFFKLADLDELLRDLSAARADLVKLMGGK